MSKTFTKVVSLSAMAAAMIAANAAQATCDDVSRAALQTNLNAVVLANSSGGFNLPMWLTFVDESGMVCEVVTSGKDGSVTTSAGAAGVMVARDKWLGSRVISAQKANTANAFSLNGVSISSGALFAAVQPGASLFGLQESNPVNAAAAYAGSAANFGTVADPMKVNAVRIGGVNVFGGGLAVYKAGRKVGAIGVSGDTSCTDHAVAWQVREAIGGGAGTAGVFEKLTLTNTFGALGDHPSCGSDDVQAGNASLGFN